LGLALGRELVGNRRRGKGGMFLFLGASSTLLGGRGRVESRNSSSGPWRRIGDVVGKGKRGRKRRSIHVKG